MDRLLESLENTLDDIGNPDYEVEYSVRSFESMMLLLQFMDIRVCIERSSDVEVG